MTNKKISALAGATTPLSGTEFVPIVQSGATDSVSVANLTAGRVVTMSGLAVGTASPTYLTDFQGPTSPSSRIRNTTAATPGTATLLLEVANNFSGTSQSYVQGTGSGSSGTSELAFGVSLTSGSVTGTEVFRMTNDGNLVPKVAAKGINFTANTPAAGMTSQLLNWYEEGTWTPVVTAALGSITAYTASGTYTRIGRLITTTLKIEISNNGTGLNGVFATLPFTNGAVCYEGYGREDALTGAQLQALCLPASTTMTIVTYNNAYPGGTGARIYATLTYSI